jgi:hypothetical protein
MMYRKLFIFIVLLIFSSTLIAQRFNGGLLAGGNVSQLDGDNYGGYHKFGYQAGAFVSLRVSPHSSFQMEMEYIQKGSRINADTLTNLGDTYLFRFHYLEIPLLYQYSVTNKKWLSFEAGPAMDVLLGSLEESNGQEKPSVIPLRTVTLAGIFGVSAFLTDHLKVNFRFNYSLLSIRETKLTYPATYPPSYRHILFEKGQYNNVMTLSLFWYFKPRGE